MAAIQLNSNTKWDSLLNDPGNSVLKEQLVSANTYPLLSAYYEYIRKINNVHNKKDLEVENDQLIAEFNYICNHNLLYYLTVIGRFDLIRELFKDVLSDEERYIIHLIQAEREKAAQLVTQNTGLATLVPDTGKANISMDYSQNAFGLSHMDCYRYCDQEITRVTQEYHVAQINVHTQALNQNLNHLQNLYDEIEEDDSIPEEVVNETAVHLARFRTEHRELTQLAQDASPTQDISVLEERLKKIESLNDSGMDLEAFLKKHSQQHKTFMSTYKLVAAVNLEKTTTLAQNKSVFQQLIDDLMTHKRNAQKGTNAEIDQSLRKLIDMVELAPTEKMDKKTVGQVKEALIRLEKYKEEIPHLHNTEEKQAVLKKCAKELSSIYEVIKPNLEPEAAKDLARELAFFKERVNHHKAQADNPTTKNFKMHYAEAMGNSFSTPGAGNDNKAKYSFVNYGSTPQGTVGVGKTSSFKGEVQVFREKLTDLTEEQQESLKENLSLLKTHLNKIKMNKSCSAENLAVIKEIEQFVENTESIQCKKICAPDLNNVCQQLNELNNIYSELDELTVEFNSLRETLENNTSERRANNNP